MIIKKSPKEIETMDEANRIVRKTLEAVATAVQAGATTWDLEMVAEREISAAGAQSAFKGYRGFPCSLCVSINDEVVHGIPSKKRVLKDGDIVSVDFGVKWKGFYGDSAVTVPVGHVTKRHQELINVTQEAMHEGIQKMRAGAKLSDVSNAVQVFAERHDFGVVREFVGHGIGSSLHEDPQLPNYGQPGRGPVLEAGMVIAIEPMVTEKNYDVKVADDGWTASTCDGGYAAHFEKSVAVTDSEPRILGL